MSTSPNTPRALGAALLLAAAFATPAAAQEVSRGAAPTPDNVEELGGAMQEAFEEEEREPPPFFPGLQKIVQRLPPFLRDTELHFLARTFFWNESRVDKTESQAWAVGGAFDYRSGWLKETFRIGAAVYTSQKLVGPKGKDGTGLLREGQRGYTVAGKAYAEFRFKGQNLKLFRQGVDLPYINAADTRMTPNTFEAYMLRGKIPELPYVGEIAYHVGWIERIRQRGEDSFDPMSEAAGVSGGDEGVATATFRLRPWQGFYFGVTNHLNPDTINILYGEGSFVHTFDNQIGLRLEGQATYQTSIGKEQLLGSPFDTWHVSARLAASYANAILTLGYSQTSDEAEIRDPWGLFPGYLGLMQSDFNQAGEDAFLLGISYDFKDVGAPGLSGFINYAQGFDGAILQEGVATGEVSNEQAIDGTLDYRFPDGPLKGLWIRLRGSYLNVEGLSRNGTQLRIILNYDFPIL